MSAKFRRMMQRRGKDSTSRFLSQRDLREIRRAVDVENSRARRKGKKPKDAQIGVFSCRCNCFWVEVLEDRISPWPPLDPNRSA